MRGLPAVHCLLLIVLLAGTARADGNSCGAITLPPQEEADGGFVAHRCPHFRAELPLDTVLDGFLTDAVDEADARAQAMSIITTYCGSAAVEDPYIRLASVERHGRRQWHYVALATCTPR